MTVRLTRFLTGAERDAINADATARGYYNDDHRIMRPGWGWFEPWYWDPAVAARFGLQIGDPASIQASRARGDHEMYGENLLSEHYRQTWARIRPPICVVLPDGEHWEIDRKSSNGSGWVVTGTWPDISCSPSIAAKGYHGFLGMGGAPAGHFTNDLDGHGGPDGAYPYPRTWRRLVQFDPADPRRVRHETVPGDPPADYREPVVEGAELIHHVGD